MKFFNLLFLFSLATSFLAGAIPLSDHSKQSIGFSALKGASIGAVAGSVANMLVNFVAQKKTISDAIKKNVVYAFPGAILIGALGGALYKYFHTPEKYYDYAKKELSKIEQDSAVKVLYEIKPENWVQKLRVLWAQSSYPLASGHSWLNHLHARLMDIKKSASEALVLENDAIVQETQEMIAYVNATLILVEEALASLAAQPTFPAEYSAKMHEDAAKAAKSAKTSAHTRWVNSINSHPHFNYTQNITYTAPKYTPTYTPVQTTYTAPKSHAPQPNLTPSQAEAHWQMTRSLLSTVQN